MRLTSKEVDAIKSSIYKFDPKAKIYPFGSRIDPKKRGGDIDLLVFSDVFTELDKVKIEMALFEKMEEQKVDIVIAKDDSHPFVKIALKNGIRL